MASIDLLYSGDNDGRQVSGIPWAYKAPMGQLMAADAADTNIILAAQPLLAAAQVLLPGSFAQPDCYRCLRVVGGAANMEGDVIIEGVDWKNEPVREVFALDETTPVLGEVAFRLITKITLPPLTTAGDTVDIGTQEVFGLYGSISADADVVSAFIDGTGLTAPGTIDLDKVNPTVALNISDGDLFGFNFMGIVLPTPLTW